jgi:hypothetical protein
MVARRSARLLAEIAPGMVGTGAGVPTAVNDGFGLLIFVRQVAHRHDFGAGYAARETKPGKN